jgi:hypothetical protein
MRVRAQKKDSITPAESMRRKREALYANNYQQCKLSIPSSLFARLKETKQTYGLRGLDAVVENLVRRARQDYRPADLELPPEPQDGDEPHTITIHLPREQVDYLDSVVKRFRGVKLGVAFEAIAAVVDYQPRAPVQLSLIQENDAVSG